MSYFNYYTISEVHCHCYIYYISIIHINVNYIIFIARVVLVVRGSPDNILYSSDCRIMENREDKKSVDNIMNPSVKPLLGAVTGTVVGVVVGYYLSKVGMTVGGLVGFIVGSFVGVVVSRSIDKIRHN